MNSGDGIDYHQRFSENIGDLIEVKLFKDPMLLPSHKKTVKHTGWLKAEFLLLKIQQPVVLYEGLSQKALNVKNGNLIEGTIIAGHP